MTFVTEINAMGFLSLSTKIMERFLIFVFAEGAGDSIHSPLIPAIGAKEIPLSRLLPQQT
jgi:hypothetical protein